MQFLSEKKNELKSNLPYGVTEVYATITAYNTDASGALVPNVTQYKIVKIFTNETKDGVVFVIEKKIEDENGVSIRYMVETTKLDSPVDGQKR